FFFQKIQKTKKCINCPHSPLLWSLSVIAGSRISGGVVPWWCSTVALHFGSRSEPDSTWEPQCSKQGQRK
ncbi:Uncharacterized protein APZ42_007495, partial [Daphnia magna]